MVEALEVYWVDSYLPTERAAEMGAEIVEMEERVMARGDTGNIIITVIIMVVGVRVGVVGGGAIAKGTGGRFLQGWEQCGFLRSWVRRGPKLWMELETKIAVVCP